MNTVQILFLHWLWHSCYNRRAAIFIMPAPASESALVEIIRRKFALRGQSRGLAVGMGDDAAIFQIAPGRLWAISTDAFLEGNHFSHRWHQPQEAGYKALARAVSDLAAMGARPKYFTMNLAVPAKLAGRWLNHFLNGVRQAARRYRMNLIGGDTTRPLAHGFFSANFMVMGELAGYQPVLRSGARPGDILYLSGLAGGAQLGLEMIKKGAGRNQRTRALLRRHLRPEPRLELGEWLARQKLATAMIDTSDGLSTDLQNLCAASGVGATLSAASLPVVAIPAELRRLALHPVRLGLHGGDDYELLFAVRPRDAQRIPAYFKKVPLTRIGRITHGAKITMDTAGKIQPLRASGWDPFR